ncbi:MAG: cytidylate kinase family protein [Chloroflexi bacterium]|nr:cytidylate kinase family protein [Chloroflexota bacterium]
MAVISISRQMGALGEEIGQELAERVGYEFVDRPRMIAEAERFAAGGQLATAPELQERAPGFWQRFVEERRRYSIVLKALVYEFAWRDRAVIVGSGSEIHLKGINHVFRVKVVAPFLVRVQRVMEQQELDKQAATELVTRSDRDRTGYMQYLFHVNWRDAELYDLILNTGRMSVGSAVDLLVSVLQIPELVPAAASLSRLTDLALQSRVEATLVNDPRIGAGAIQVEARDGTVTLAGSVATEEERELAEAVTRDVEGVRIVESTISVVPPISAGFYP